MKSILKYALIIAGVWAVYVTKVWASRTGFPLLTAAGYVLIIGAVLGLIIYALRPAARTMPPRKFVGSAFFLLALGIAGIALDGEKKVSINAVPVTNTAEPLTNPPKDVAGFVLDGEKKVRTSSVPVTNTVEPPPSPSKDKELLTQVIYEFKDAFTRKQTALDLWGNILKVNANKQELENYPLSALKILTSQHNEQCKRFELLTDKIIMIDNKEARGKLVNAFIMSINRCKIATRTMDLTYIAVAPENIKLSGGTVGKSLHSVLKVQKDELLEAKKLESEMSQLFTSALTAGMNPDLESYQ